MYGLLHKSKTLQGERVKYKITVFPYRNDLVPTLNWVFENQPKETGILTQPSRRNQFASRRKRSLKNGGDSYNYLYVHLYY